MPSRSPARSSADGPILVVAVSARSLAEAVARAGRRALAVDLFGDEDTRTAAAGVAVVPGSLHDGPDLDAVMAAGERLGAEHGAPAGVVVGSGFEHRPATLAALAARWPLIGSPPAAVAAVKDPRRLAALCAELSIPHPAVAFAPPGDPSAWLVKRAGGCGGSHVAPADAETHIDVGSGRYFQRRVDGRAMSATVLCAADGARLLAFCTAAFAPTAASPFRFGGLEGPVAVDADVAGEVAAAAGGLAAATGLLGLVGLDLVVDGRRWWLIEVNPRPTAALDVLDRGRPALMSLHLSASAGAALPTWTPPAHAAATAVVYAERDGVAAGCTWPSWAADRPTAGTPIPAGTPLCTVRADGGGEVARARLTERAGHAAALALGASAGH